MRASLERLYLHLSDISIKLNRAAGSDKAGRVDKKDKKVFVEKDDVRIDVAKTLERLQMDRAEYLEALKEKIAQGEYRVSAEEVAARIIGVIERG